MLPRVNLPAVKAKVPVMVGLPDRLNPVALFKVRLAKVAPDIVEEAVVIVNAPVVAVSIPVPVILLFKFGLTAPSASVPAAKLSAPFKVSVAPVATVMVAPGLFIVMAPSPVVVFASSNPVVTERLLTLKFT